MSLVLWIAIHIDGIDNMLAYMDDNFSEDSNPDLVRYEPYQAFFPSKQVRLLRLWDALGIPHKQPKQVFGCSLTIIGFHVDSDAMTVALPDDARLDLVHSIREFVLDAPARKRPLRRWQRLLGWINWGLNVQPLLRPALASSYEKMRGKQHPARPLYLNKAVITDLLWVADMFEEYGGVHILRSRAWKPHEAELEVLCDACLTGLGFWSPARQEGFMAALPVSPDAVEDTIFWYESLCVLAALQWAAALHHCPRRLAIYTDNLNTVQIFDCFRASAPYNSILHAASATLIASGIDLRVWHIPGSENVVADALSRGMLPVAHSYASSLRVLPFRPPQLKSGAAEK
ncbi:uncharacterized protein PHACADRAFT_190737 [Phanerochaete carnosa HHB-10118-sp]|uniref:Uncharacterized protein n=1 Tax=Phanerochaete carnosa (strain HHB-10118-sp) TaxID=650164 RepID=K5XEQ2_PHACS|nr:uncharacterized protein PHACADRAFT_190737 [Phanerochaete carnosa HHB-10118-sp]EKM61562.1 hypothetical protein PHACADRAFT_190737 [Phanerochaete carnosa HHB-10118-sp]